MALAVVVTGAAAIAIVSVVTTREELAATALTLPTLIIAAFTLVLTVPKAARLRLIRPDELGLSDLIFYVVPKPAQPGERQVPRDFLLQLVVVICNVGDRKAVLSAVTLDGFIGRSGNVVRLPDLPETLNAERWEQQFGWLNGRQVWQNVSFPPPYVLERDDVLTLRFRARRGVDWSPRWDVAALRTFAEPLEDPIESAYGVMIWRQGERVVRTPFDLRVQVEQQELYVACLRDLTDDFTTRPEIDVHPFPLE